MKWNEGLGWRMPQPPPQKSRVPEVCTNLEYILLILLEPRSFSFSYQPPSQQIMPAITIVMLHWTSITISDLPRSWRQHQRYTFTMTRFFIFCPHSIVATSPRATGSAASNETQTMNADIAAAAAASIAMRYYDASGSDGTSTDSIHRLKVEG